MKTIFDKSVPGRRASQGARNDVPPGGEIPAKYMRSTEADLPELSEGDVVRHFTGLSRRNFSVDTVFYPLGSCTMKYNPKVTEQIARYEGFAALHPLLPQLSAGDILVQGALEVLFETGRMLSEICGMADFTMQPLAGAHGELTGAMIMAAYHRDKGNRKTTIIIPDSAHGTNPASAAIAGYKVRTVRSKAGVMDVDALREALGDEVAGVMITCPNTLGIFNPHIDEICRMVHEVDGLMYCDGANLNALLGVCRPGDIGFDIIHVNLHKTFATPHGGGGPGAGPVGVSRKLTPYLPISVVRKNPDGSYHLDYDLPKSVGYIAPFYGNFGVIVRAYVYMLMLGREGLKRVSENAVLNANYVKRKLAGHYDFPFDGVSKHECVLSAARQAKKGVHALDIAKALMDRGFHPPTMYFPTTVPEALMIEPTETESKETLDEFVEAMVEIARLAEESPEEITSAPRNTVVGRLDERRAAVEPDLAQL